MFRKIIDNVIDLEEISQNFNLYGNKLQVTIADEVVLPNVVIFETDDEIFVFIATTRSIHQLIFAHPTHQKYVSIYTLYGVLLMTILIICIIVTV